MAKKISLEYQQLTDCAKELNKLKNMQIEALTRIRRMSSIYFNSEQRAMSRNIKEFESDISYSISINNKSVSSTVDLVNYLNKAVRDFSAAEQDLSQMINASSKIKDIENNLGALLNVWGKELTSINKNELKSLPNTAEKLKENIMNDFSAIWKSFDKNDEELNKVITAANTIIKAAWNYNKEEHPIEAGIESSLANFATSTIKGIGGLLNGVGEQWYNLREDPSGTLKNWWNFTVDVVAFLSPNLPKTEDDLNFEYNLANSIIKDGDTRLVHGDAYSRTQYIADWVLNIGSLFLGGEAIDSIKGLGKTGEVAADTSKIEKISEVGDINVAAKTTNLWKESTCSIDELYNYLKNINSDAAEAFLKDRTWPSDMQIPKNSSVLNADGTINWAKAPKGGYVLDSSGNPIKEQYTPSIGEIIDRNGPPNGRYTSPVVDGKPYSHDQRALPYLEDVMQNHQYEVTGDISKLEEYVANCPDATLKSQIESDIDYYYNGDYSKVITYKGDIASIDGWGTGGGVQYEFPIKVEYLEKLGILKEIR